MHSESISITRDRKINDRPNRSAVKIVQNIPNDFQEFSKDLKITKTLIKSISKAVPLKILNLLKSYSIINLNSISQIEWVKSKYYSFISKKSKPLFSLRNDEGNYTIEGVYRAFEAERRTKSYSSLAVKSNHYKNTRSPGPVRLTLPSPGLRQSGSVRSMSKIHVRT